MIHSNLSTSSSECREKVQPSAPGRWKRWGVRLGHLLSAAGVVAVLMGCFLLADMVYVREDEHGRCVWHSYYEEEKPIDNLFLGSSHVYCDVDPFLMDELTGENNYNLCFSAMRINASYYALREAARSHALKNVYLEMYYGTLTGPSGDLYNTGSVTNNWKMSDYMRLSPEKLKFIFSMSGRDKYLDTILPFIRFREHLFDKEYIFTNLARKMSESYRAYEFYEEGKEETDYLGKGYFACTRTYSDEERNSLQERLFPDDAAIGESSMEYLKKIILFCQERGIHLTLFVAPIYELQVLSTVDYDSYVTEVRSIADDYGVAYYDFNLCKPEYLDIQHNAYFQDIGHLNNDGVAKFTPFLNQVLQGSQEENEVYFCRTYQEKLLSQEPEMFGVYQTKPETGHRIFTVASNRAEGQEYRIARYTYDGTLIALQEYSPNRQFEIEMDEHGYMVLEMRAAGQDTAAQTITVHY